MQSRHPMKEFVINMLKTKLPTNYYYHNFHHTLYVVDKTLEIAKEENCTVPEKRLLMAAALWHDTGYIYLYNNHEEKSCSLAREYLPEFGFSDKEIHSICGMIMATKAPQAPLNKLEEILADADLEYLGTESAGKKAGDLFKELKSISPLLLEEQWNQSQIIFLKNHRYFTTFCKLQKEPRKLAYLDKLENEPI
jgi:HD superfamily phosphodiesterase